MRIKKKNAFCYPQNLARAKRSYIGLLLYLVNVSKIRHATDRNKIVYPDVPSSIGTVIHSDMYPIPIPTTSSEVTRTMFTSTPEVGDMNINDKIVYQNAELGTPHILNQDNLDDLVRDFYLNKTGS